LPVSTDHHSTEGKRSLMSHDVHLVSRTVVCPRCHADAVISYPRTDQPHPSERQRDIVYVCPNLCALHPHQAAELIPRRHP
jgi:hypothetical protein